MSDSHRPATAWATRPPGRRSPFVGSPARTPLAVPPGLTEAIVARLCHDLASPLGAIANGLELLGLAGGGDGPELDLVTDSASAATTRLRLLRLAFGPVAGSDVPRAEMAAALGAIRGERLSVDWLRPDPVPRPEARIAALAMLALDAALPRGGRVEVRWERRWLLAAEGPAVADGLPAWGWLTDAYPRQPVIADSVQFPSLRLALDAAGRSASLKVSPGSLRLTA